MLKIAVVTGTRADYGLLYPLLKLLKQDPEIELQLIVCCMHWLKEFGETNRLITEDGFKIDAKVDMLLGNDDSSAIAKSVGLGVLSFSDALQHLAPDLLVVLGDRFEIVAAAQTAFIARIPIVHIHGGEITFGAIDEGFRHVITKLSHLHFVAAEPYRKRVIQLGESPERVFNVGAIGLDNIKILDLLDRDSWQEAVDFQLGELNFLVTYHPATIAPERTYQVVQELLAALDQFPHAHLLITKSNADESGRMIGKMLQEYGEKRGPRVKVVANLGSMLYLSALQHFQVMIGNSSSGLIEVPFFAKPSVNIGPRQAGRLRASSVIDCEETSSAIHHAIEVALSEPFQESLHSISTPYGQGDAAENIIRVIKKFPLGSLIHKEFYDLPEKP